MNKKECEKSMGFYYDKVKACIIRNDRQLDMMNPFRYVRHEYIGLCKCPFCTKRAENSKVSSH